VTRRLAYLHDWTNLAGLSHQAAHVYLFLVARTGGRGAIAVPVRMIASMIGSSQHTVTRAIASLAKRGLLTVEASYDAKTGARLPNLYILERQ
jgi:DNA-binding MarR family transcriptional regulator